MEVLAILFVLFIMVVLLVGLLCVLTFVLVIVWGFWPAVLGITLGAWLWVSGADNLGALCGLAGLAGNMFWIDWATSTRGEGTGTAKSGGGGSQSETTKDILRDIRDRLPPD